MNYFSSGQPFKQQTNCNKTEVQVCQAVLYLCLLDSGDPREAALRGAGDKYVDIHGTLKLTDLNQNK